ncbi:hypothetical protein [Spirosoma telluris]
MNYLIRFYLYDDPSRQNVRQLGSDHWTKKPPSLYTAYPTD